MVGAINIEYEKIELENGNIEQQSGELKVKLRQKCYEKVGNFSVKCWDTKLAIAGFVSQNLTEPNLT